MLDALVTYRLELAAVVAVLAGLVLLRRVLRGLRRRRPAQIHPKLAKYAGRSEADIEADRIAAQNVIATSSTSSLAGYDIVRQIEAVFVEGHRAPQEAVQALRAAAGRLGANAIINLAQERTTAGRCTARGDAVLVRPTIVRTTAPQPPPQPARPQPPKAGGTRSGPPGPG